MSIDIRDEKNYFFNKKSAELELNQKSFNDLLDIALNTNNIYYQYVLLNNIHNSIRRNLAMNTSLHPDLIEVLIQDKVYIVSYYASISKRRYKYKVFNEKLLKPACFTCNQCVHTTDCSKCNK